MKQTSTAAREASAVGIPSSALVPAIGLLLALGLQLHLALTRSINWDEFHFLSQVHEFTRGELARPIQTFHVRIFAWLPSLGVPGVDQVVTARLVMFGAELVTCTSIILIARRFVELPLALTCALAYLSVGYVFQHGFSFRTDPLAISLCMSSLAILARSRLKLISIFSFAVLMGVAFVVTIKIVLLAPAFAGIAWLRWSEQNFSLRRGAEILAAPILAIGFAALLFAWHSSNIAPPAIAADQVSHAGGRMFFLGVGVNWSYAIFALLKGIPFAIALCFLIASLRDKLRFTSAQKIALLGLALPLSSLLYYNNTYPYFYAFMLAPVAASLAGAMPALEERYGLNKIVLLMALNASLIWFVDGESRLNKQRQIQIAANEMFAKPVNYFDFPGFLPEHRKSNFFITVWGMKNYQEGLVPTFLEIMMEKPVPLVAAIDPAHNASLLGAMEKTERQHLFAPQDRIALQSTYRHVWGPLYVAGKTVSAGQSLSWNVLVPGTYTVEGKLIIDGKAYQDGDLVALDRGQIYLTAPKSTRGGLLWGDHIKVPDTPAPERPYWTGF